MDKEEIKAFIDDYCKIVQKHGLQFTFIDDEISIEIWDKQEKQLVIGQTYPNIAMARFVGVLMGWRMPKNLSWYRG